VRILIAIGVPRQQEAGAAGVALNHARELERRGHRVDCWFLDDILGRQAKPRRFSDLSFAIAIAKRILREKGSYDVVNLHAPWGCAYGVCRKMLRRADMPPYVLTMQGSEERYVFAMRREHRKNRASNFALKNRLWHRLYHQTMYNFSIKTADYGAVANREAWICAELKYNRDPGRICFVPNGTEERFFMNRKYGQTTKPALLYVGSWLDRKGIHYLVEAFQILARKNPGIRLTVAGCLSSEDNVKSFLSPEVRDQVRVLPFVKRAEMPSVYADHDIFVFPSLVEGMPLTLLEAMASAMPVVTTNTSGMADVVEDGVNGLLVPAADAGRLADAIERLCDSVALREDVGRQAQETMRRYTWERVVEKLEAVLRLASVQPQGSR